jgi:exopolysaccharide biosynthesis polyprenyl glycosylphosphotransferase
MLGEYSTLLRRAAIATDLVVVVGSFLLAYIVRNRLPAPEFGQIRPIEEYLWLLAVVVVIWLSCFHVFGFYRSFRYRERLDIFGSLARAHAVGALLLLSVLFVARRWEVSRLFTQVFLAISFVAIVTEKLAVVSILRHQRRAGRNRQAALVVGAVDRAASYIRFLRDHPYWGIRVVGVVDDGSSSPGAAEPEDEVEGVQVVGSIKDLPEIFRSQPTDEVVFAIGPREFPLVEEYLDLCQEMGVTSRLVLDLPQRGWTRQDFAWVDGVAILSLDSVRVSPWRLAVKRAIDVAGALVGLVLFAVAYLWYGPRIRRDSPGPVLFSQVRVGRHGRLFALYKFRTMYVDAEARHAELMAANEMQGALFKLRDDPRITPLGKWLRARHLDELPQFWNVLRGEMSLVGTRPPTLDEVERYRPHHRRRLSMKPGITGLWQLAGNQEIRDFEEIVRLDCQYIDSWSMWLDTRILARTVVKVVHRSGW